MANETNDAAERIAFLASCEADELEDAEDFFAECGVCRYCHNGEEKCTCP